ncbi:hypothetical protein COLO4_04512 [Corchorus olitorius]|uniref:Uncharacterized protein n=1 Tax=Corchorus olitorius TaxID=93759 RepID=A0A1R3KTM1_9ROSI|nr:hypothetical protein COLO4_04512 [Corchorus olitorius]
MPICSMSTKRKLKTNQSIQHCKTTTLDMFNGVYYA